MFTSENISAYLALIAASYIAYSNTIEILRARRSGFVKAGFLDSESISKTKEPSRYWHEIYARAVVIGFDVFCIAFILWAANKISI